LCYRDRPCLPFIGSTQPLSNILNRLLLSRTFQKVPEKAGKVTDASRAIQVPYWMILEVSALSKRHTVRITKVAVRSWLLHWKELFALRRAMHLKRITMHMFQVNMCLTTASMYHYSTYWLLLLLLLLLINHEVDLRCGIICTAEHLVCTHFMRVK
jgi:hypothetical protein